MKRRFFFCLFLLTSLHAKEFTGLDLRLGVGTSLFVGNHSEIAVPSNFGWGVSLGSAWNIPFSENMGILPGLEIF
jgi:hypothetical protein